MKPGGGERLPPAACARVKEEKDEERSVSKRTAEGIATAPPRHIHEDTEDAENTEDPDLLMAAAKATPHMIQRMHMIHMIQRIQRIYTEDPDTPALTSQTDLTRTPAKPCTS
jgi:hypothetical protein